MFEKEIVSAYTAGTGFGKETAHPNKHDTGSHFTLKDIPNHFDFVSIQLLSHVCLEIVLKDKPAKRKHRSFTFTGREQTGKSI